MRDIYFVVSLPRTGTKSLCKMAHACGYEFRHAPINLFKKELDSGKNFFSDTPCFVPSFIENIFDIEGINPKFIYIEKDYDKLFNSWEKVNLYLNYTRMFKQYENQETRQLMNPNAVTDFLSLHESFSETYLDKINYAYLFELHKQKVVSIINKKNKDLLMYKFEDGWEPFCNFLGCETPSTELPHLNIDTMFEKII